MVARYEALTLTLEFVSNNFFLNNLQLSYADVFFVGIHDSIVNACGAEVMSDKPHLKALREKVLAIPSIKAWIDKRPKNDF